MPLIVTVKHDCWMSSERLQWYWEIKESSCLHRASMIIKHFIIQLTHKYIIRKHNQNCNKFKSAPTCFGSQRIHNQGALHSAWLKLQEWFYRVRWHGQGRCYGSILWPVARVCSSLYREAERVTICCRHTDLVHVNGHDRIILVIFSQGLYQAPWWWILCDPKHVGALLNIL